jgi:hypothetical protein
MTDFVIILYVWSVIRLAYHSLQSSGLLGYNTHLVWYGVTITLEELTASNFVV